MAQTSTQFSQHAVRFAELDSHCALKLVRDVEAWNLYATPLLPKGFSAQIEAATIGGLQLLRLRVNGPTVLRASTLAEHTGVVLVSDVSVGVTVNGQPADDRTVWHGHANERLTVATSAPATLCFISWTGAYSPFPSRKYLQTNHPNLDQSNPIGALLQSRVDSPHHDAIERVFELLQNEAADWNRLVVAQLVDSVAAAIIEALSEATSGRFAKSKFRRFSTFADAYDTLVRVEEMGHISPKELSENCKVHLRVLQEACRDAIGMTPKQLSRLVQLQKIRECLESERQRAEPLNVLARKADFASPSHFAASYKAAFGIPPSQSRAERVPPGT